MGKLESKWTGAIAMMKRQGNLKQSGVLRVHSPGTYSKSTRSFSSPTYTGYTYYSIEDNKWSSGRSLQSNLPEIFPTDKEFLIVYTKTAISYNSSWVEQSSASTTTRPQPEEGNILYQNSLKYKVVIASDESAGTGILFRVLARKIEDSGDA